MGGKGLPAECSNAVAVNFGPSSQRSDEKSGRQMQSLCQDRANVRKSVQSRERG